VTEAISASPWRTAGYFDLCTERKSNGPWVRGLVRRSVWISAAGTGVGQIGLENTWGAGFPCRREAEPRECFGSIAAPPAPSSRTGEKQRAARVQ